MKEEEYKEALASNERKWEFRYEQQWRKQKELEETVSKLRKRIRELKKELVSDE